MPRLARLHLPLACVVAGLFCGLLPDSASAQPPERDRRKEIVGDVLRTLIESQLEQRRREGQPADPNVERVRPPVGVRPRPLPERPPLPPGVSALDYVRKELNWIVEESQELTNLLLRESRTDFNVRALVRDAAIVNAQATAASRNAQFVRDYRALANDVTTLDTKLGELLFRLRAIPQPSRERAELVEHLAEHQAALAEVYGLQGAVDYQALERQATTLLTHLKTLQDDIQWDYSRSPQHRGLVEEGLQVNRLATQFLRDVQHNDGPQQLVGSYKNFLTAWRPLNRKLIALQNRYIDRSLPRIASTDEAIQETLRMQHAPDRDRLAALSQGLRRDVVELCRGIPLSLLMRLPNGGAIPAAADELDGLCAHFADCIQRKESDAELVEAFGYIPNAWVNFSREFREVNDAELRRSFSQIEAQIKELRLALRLPERPQPREIAAVAHDVKQNSDQFRKLIAQWLSRREARGVQQQEALKINAQKMHTISEALEQALIEGHDDARITNLVENLAGHWKALAPLLRQCNTQEARVINQLAAETAEAMVTLETALLL